MSLENTMTALQTDPTLLAGLKASAKAGVPARQLRAQKVSFILGAVSDESMITKELIEEVLDRLEGNAA